MKNYELRDTQKRILNSLIKKISVSDNAAIIAGTGVGKTIMAAHLAAYLTTLYNNDRDATKSPYVWRMNEQIPNQILFIVHLDNLVEQTYQKFRDVIRYRETYMGKVNERGLWESVTFIKAKKDYNPAYPIVIASLQSLKSRFKNLVEIGHLKPSVIIYDECHTTSFCDTGMELSHKLQPHKIIGLTATPFRLEKNRSFCDIWEDVVMAPSFKELVAKGELCPIVYKQFVSSSDVEIRMGKDGEFIQKDAAIKFNTPARIKVAIAAWEKECNKLKTIVFCIDVAHGDAVKTEFMSRGYSAEVISYKTKSRDRDVYFKKFRTGEIQILISVRALAIGFDEPSCECGVDLQPLTSIANHWQKIGRIARIHPKKKQAIWLDFTGNIERLEYFGLPDNVEMDEETVLAKKDFTRSMGESPIKICPECHTVNHASVRFCQNEVCNHEFPRNQIVDDFKIQGKLITVVTESMVDGIESATEFYRNLRYKNYIKGNHPNYGYFEYSQSRISKEYPLPHPKERNAHKQISMGCITGKPYNLEESKAYLGRIIKIVTKKLGKKDDILAVKLIDNAVWHEVSDEIYRELQEDIKQFRHYKFKEISELLEI